MAAYAALISVSHIIEQIQNHPLAPVSLDKKQVESLTKNVAFLLEFLEGYPSIGKNDGDGLESRILDAAYAAEDLIESHIVDQILDGSTSQGDQAEFGQLLQKVIDDMDLIKNEVMETKEKMGIQYQLQRKPTSPSGGQTQRITLRRNSKSSSGAMNQNTNMVGFEDSLLELLDKLTGGGVNRQIMPIVGMGGMGKTTLARNVFAYPLIREHFDIFAWTTISQVYDTRNILNEILSQVKQEKRDSSEVKEKQIGEELHKYLFGRKYLIIMDDIWSIDAWDKIKFFLPVNNNGSRIVVTTRLSNLARRLSNSYCLHMKLLDLNESWDLFSEIVFPKYGYPSEMVEIGKKIVENCRGLPLSIVVVGGFMAKSEYKKEHWERIEENLSSVVNSENDEGCLKILQLSYDQLPIHLKPCFLYMGIFKEDTEIRISELVKLWVAEGFLKPISGKDLEEVAEQYINDLVDRNLIVIMKSKGKYVKIHDLLRDLCWRQAQAERFYGALPQHGVTIKHDLRHFIVSKAPSEEVDVSLLSRSLARSMISYVSRTYPSTHHRLLRIYKCHAEVLLINDGYYYQENKLQLVNLRYLFAGGTTKDTKFATSLHLLWNLQTLIIKCRYRNSFTAPAEIWNMSQLRHVQVDGYLNLPDPPVCNRQDDLVLRNLQTLTLVRNFRCTEEVVKKIPNIKKLGLSYEGEEVEKCCPNNIDRLHKLKSLRCISYPNPKPHGTGFLQKLSFPCSLKKLVFDASHVHWEDMLEKIGSLPLLQKLELNYGFFATHTWETVEGQFPSLKFLKIVGCIDLEYWNSESSHFPSLEHLVLHGLDVLNEIPSDFGEIATLQSIELLRCSKSAALSCKRIKEEHEELYGEEEALEVWVQVWEYDGLQDFASKPQL